MIPRLAVGMMVATSSLAMARLALERVATGFERPVWAGMPAPSQGQHLWVMEQAGRVWRVEVASGKRLEPPFLDLRKAVSRKGNEQGLLGLAFAPDFDRSGRYYVNFTDTGDHTRIVRLVSNDRQTTDLATAEDVLRFKQPYQNHNGGWIDFGPDGMLYIGNGDGGAGNDPENRAQALDSLLGKILRIDVSPATGYRLPPDNPFLKRAGAKPEIWAMGVRNPWRCSFDRLTGDFWMGDVGQNHWEEINFMPHGKGAGANYGWRLREGRFPTPAPGVGGPAPAGAVEPVYTYGHGGGASEGFSVTGGYVYRGPLTQLQGRYVFADYVNPRIWSFRLTPQGIPEDFQDHTADLQPQGDKLMVASFAQDHDGGLFIVDHRGSIYRIVNR